MADRAVLKPARPDLKVRIPDKDRHLAADGEELELSLYWHRRIKDGDVQIVPPAPATKPSKANQE